MSSSRENLRLDQGQRDVQQLQRRLEVLALPVLPLRRAGRAGVPPNDLCRDLGLGSSSVWGVGPNGDLWAFWPSRDDATCGAVTRTATGARGDLSVIEVKDAPLGVHFVQPMPGGGFLLSSARERGPDDVTCRVYDANGQVVGSGTLGDAVEHVLTTPTGQIWVGHFDENPRGVIRYDSGLRQQWATGRDMPSHFDCYALNVDGEVALSCAYTDFHLTRMVDGQWADLGQSPHRGASGLLVHGDFAALVGGYLAEYDLLVPVRITVEGIVPAAGPRRLVLPDGMELNGPRRIFCRGPQLHVLLRGAWFRLDLQDLLG